MAFEGDSEGAFCAWLQDLCDSLCLNVHLDRPHRMSGGDPLSLVRRAIALRERSKKSAGVGHRSSLMLIDTDRLDDQSPRSEQAIELAEQNKLIIIRQRPCLEAVLLRLHPGYEYASPASPRNAQDQLARVWPNYTKPPTKVQFAGRFRLDDLRRIAGSDSEIRRLVTTLGLQA